MRKKRSRQRSRKTTGIGKFFNIQTQSSKENNNDEIISKLKVKEHPILFRMTTSNNFLDSHKEGVYTLENDFSEKIEGKSFTANPEVMEIFYKSKMEEINSLEDFDNIPMIVVVRENALIEDKPISLSNLPKKTLYQNPEIVDFLFNPQGSHGERFDYWDSQFEKYADLSDSQKQKLLDYGVSKKDLEEAIKLSTEMLEIKKESERFKEYLWNPEKFSEEEQEEFEDSPEPEDYEESVGELWGTQPYLLRIESAYEVSHNESEIITTKPTKISYDDMKILVESEEDKQILVKQLPLLETHTEVVRFIDLWNNQVKVDFE